MRISRIAHVAVILALGVFFSIGPRTAALGDMTVTQETTTSIGDSKTTSTQTTYWTKTKMRAADPSGRIVITDLDKKTMTILDPKQKMYMEQSFEEMKKMLSSLPAAMRDMKLIITETDEKKTIDSYPCEKLVFKIGPVEIVVWVTKKIAVDPAVAEFTEKFMELTKEIDTLNMQAKMQAAFQKHKAYPYLTVMEMALPLANKVQRTEMKVKKVSYDKVDPSVFAIPEGYQKMTLPEMPPQK